MFLTTAFVALCWCASAANGRRDVTPQTYAARPADTFLDAFMTVASDSPSLTDMSQFVEAIGSSEHYPPSADNGDQGRGKKIKPGQIAMAMIGSAAGSMMMMKTMAAFKLILIKTIFVAKIGLIIGAYLLASKIIAMKQSQSMKKTVIKWEPPPPPPPPPAMSYDDYASPAADQHYPADASSYDSHPPQDHLRPPDEYGAPPPPGQPDHFQYQPQDQYQVQDPYSDQQQHHSQPQQMQQPYMPPDKLQGDDGDLHAHFSHVRPVTYRPKIGRNQLNDLVKSVVGAKA